VEPAAKGHPLFELENFIGTPHMAAHTEEALKRMSQVAVDILRVLEGKEPLYPVNPVVGKKPVDVRVTRE
jgi:D-3-phosphoglycerate dehydrogenase